MSDAGDPGPTVVLAPGAGAPSTHPYMEFFARALAEAGAVVCRFDFPYTERGRRAPDPAPVLERRYQEVLAEVRARRPGTPLVVGGRSMGGRVASQVVAAGEPCDGLLLLAYPLHPPGRPERLRDAHLGEVRVPLLFVQGTRDPFCPLETLEEVIVRRRLNARVHVVVDGDHSHRVRKSSGRTTEQAWGEAAAAVADWILEVADRAQPPKVL